MGSDALRIKVEVDTGKAVDEVGALRDALEETRDAAKNIFAKGMSESLPEQLSDIAKGFEIAGDKTASFATRLQGGVGAALIARTAMVDLAGRAVDLARAFGESRAAIEQEQRALRALGDNYASIRAATSDTTTAAEALTMRQTLLRAGLQANADTLARVSRLGREYAQTYGGSATEAVNQFTVAIQSGDAAALQPFGVRLGQTKNQAERMSAAVEQLGERFSRTAAAGRTATEDAAAFDRGLTRMRNETLTGLNRMFLHIPEGIHAAVTALGDMIPVERGVADATDHASRGLERQAEAARTTATATAALTSELSKADEQLKAFENTLHEAPTYTQGANEGYQAAVSRASQQAVNAMGRNRATRHMQRDVRRALGRGWTAADLAAAGLPPDAPTDMAAIQRAMERAVRRKRVELSQHLGAISGDTATGYAGIDVGDVDTYYDPNGNVLDPGKRQARIDMQSAYGAAERERTLAEYARADASAVERKAGESDRMGAEYTRGQRNNLGSQVVGAFAATRTAAEQGAESVKSSFDTMTQGLNGFMDTLIESPERAGEASVALAKGVLKGIAMMALQKSLFSTAEGVVALTNPITAPTAAGFFAAAGIYAGVAVAAGAGAAGIAAGQRGATQAVPPSNSGGLGAARVDSGSRGRSGGGDTYVISVNGSILDTGGFEQAVGRAVRGARGRGA